MLMVVNGVLYDVWDDDDNCEVRFTDTDEPWRWVTVDYNLDVRDAADEKITGNDAEPWIAACKKFQFMRAVKAAERSFKAAEKLLPEEYKSDWDCVDWQSAGEPWAILRAAAAGRPYPEEVDDVA